MVISVSMTMPVSTAPVDPPIAAAMPAIAKVGMATSSSGISAWQRCPNAAPPAAPMNKAGENTPPDAPEPSDRQVAKSFSAASRSRNPGSFNDPRRISMIVAYPTPST